MKIRKPLILLLTAALLTSGCQIPQLNALDPDTGPERTLVEIDGNHTFLASTWWDAGSPGEQALPSGFLSSSLFTVPVGASLGAHDVQLRNSQGSSRTLPFTVTAPVTYGVPRTDRVSLSYASFEAGGMVNTWLYVQVANADGAAEVLIDGVVQPTILHKGHQNELWGINPNHLDNPIHHWLAFVVAPGPRAVGSAIQVQCRNSDGQLSNSMNYMLPASASTLDSDGDDFPDEWELNGYDADGNGTIDIDLPALGANPHRPDIFVEVDVMNGLTNTPGAAVWTAVTTAFGNAPIINPMSTTPNGINLHLETTGRLAFVADVSLTEPDDATAGLANFYTLKTANFDNANRDRIYHYCVWGNMQPGGWSGISDVDINAAGTDFVGPGDDFIVSFDNFNASVQTVRSMAATFMHELGHNLQQRHGGVHHGQTNPTYNSVMSYSWQLRTGLTAATRIARPIYAPLCYQLNSAAEVNGAIPAGVTSVLPDYSSGMGRDLDEDDLDEPTGIYNGNGVDWNQDGDTADLNRSRDLTGDGDTNDIAVDFPNWFRLVYSGPRRDGEYGN